MELNDYRKELDRIDEEMLQLFVRRMDISAEIAGWKKENGLPVLDQRREKQKLQRVEELTPENLSDYSFTLFSMIMELSRSRQNRILHRESQETLAIEAALRALRRRSGRSLGKPQSGRTDVDQGYTIWKLMLQHHLGRSINLNTAIDNIFNYKPKTYYYCSPLTTGTSLNIGLSVDLDRLFTSHYKDKLFLN